MIRAGRAWQARGAVLNNCRVDDKNRTRLVRHWVENQVDEETCFFATAPFLAGLHDVGARGPRGLCRRAIEGARSAGPSSHHGPTHGSRNR